MVNKDLSGFDDWVPIFAGGKQIDSRGLAHDGDEMIDKAIEQFDPEYHEPPLTVGHPQDNSPAFGWVSALRKVTQKLKDGSKINVLMAKFKDVVPEFAQAVRQGLYKKRSASFYPDGRLRHVGFLGGMPPAVKGLTDLKFEEGERCMLFADALGLKICDQFSANLSAAEDPVVATGERETTGSQETTGNQKAAGSRDAALNQGNQNAAGNKEDAVDNTQAKTALTINHTEGKESQNMSHTEEHLQSLLEQQKERFTAEFEEKLQKRIMELTERLNQVASEADRKIEDAKEQGRREAAADFAEQRRKDGESARKKEIGEFITSGIHSGQILPAWEKLGLAQFMEGLGAEETLNFAEGKKGTQYQWFRDFLTELPKTINFGEFATRSKNVAASGSAGQQLNDLITRKMKDNPRLDYMSAFSEVQRENPDLVRDYEQEIHLAR
ncbi:MAG: hypothetical protein AB1847_11395 [bacterium]